MREIKFRAWDKTEKRFITEVGIECAVNHGFKSETSAFIFGQFTGLRDKNGREIYEGDIIKFTFIPFPETVTTTDKVRIGEVFFKTEGSIDYCIKVEREGNFMLNSNDIRQYEIIGNIHENKELLK